MILKTLKNRAGKTAVGFVSLSAFAHGAILLALILVPNLKQLPLGNNVDIDFVDTEVSGQPEPIRQSAPAPVLAVAEVAPAPEVAPKPKIAKAVAKNNSTPLAAPKIYQPKVIEIPMDQQEEMPNEVDTSENPTKEDLANAAEVAAEDKKAIEEEPLQEQQIEELPPKVTPVAADQKPVDAPATNQSEEQTTSNTTQPGETRSYLDLKQAGGNMPPQYPVLARRNGWQGEVTLNYYVTSSGTVQDVKVVESSGFADLDQAAVKAISKYRYIPGQEGWTSHPVSFSLKGGPTNAPSKLRTSSSRNLSNKGG